MMDVEEHNHMRAAGLVNQQLLLQNEYLVAGPSGSRSFNEIEFLDITGST